MCILSEALSPLFSVDLLKPEGRGLTLAIQTGTQASRLHGFRQRLLQGRHLLLLLPKQAVS